MWTPLTRDDVTNFAKGILNFAKFREFARYFGKFSEISRNIVKSRKYVNDISRYFAKVSFEQKSTKNRRKIHKSTENLEISKKFLGNLSEISSKFVKFREISRCQNTQNTKGTDTGTGTGPCPHDPKIPTFAIMRKQVFEKKMKRKKTGHKQSKSTREIEKWKTEMKNQTEKRQKEKIKKTKEK